MIIKEYSIISGGLQERPATDGLKQIDTRETKETWYDIGDAEPVELMQFLSVLKLHRTAKPMFKTLCQRWRLRSTASAALKPW